MAYKLISPIDPQNLLYPPNLVCSKSISNGLTPYLPDVSMTLWLPSENIPIGPVATWLDASGNENNATQTTFASQPTGVANQINGHAGVVFDGVDDSLVTPLENSTPFTYFIVSKLSSSGAFQMLISANQKDELRYNTSDEIQFEPQASPVTDSVSSLSLNIISTVDNGTLLKNGTIIGSTSTTSSSDLITIGSRNGSSFFLGGSIYEILIYPAALSDANREIVETKLGTKFGITITH